MGLWHRLLARSPGDYPRFATAAVLLLAIDVAVTVGSFERLRNGLVRVATALARLVPGTPHPVRVVWAVEVADDRVPGDRKCLVRSLSAEFLLRLYGVEPLHRIGVDPTGEFEAHSWLEYDDEIIIGDLDDMDRYEPLPPLNDQDSA